ncbi:hypothetical protein [Xanthomonas arboricola]|uniref:hypothetical protein n=1 Tax=Xanthomonas arboricola TaxID=56448 RepID=UPI000CED9A0B|nr:hypothetical protein [Xanthomonas arboricola]PPT26841.1 hypothetical protein XarbCFBP7614_14725 [Xanthomonas arboricola]
MTNAGAATAVQPVLASDLVFGHPRELFRLTHVGNVVVSEGVSTTDAARAFWDAVAQMRPRLDAAGLKELSCNPGKLQKPSAASRLNEPFGDSEQLAPGALDYALGRLDREAPQRVWLQIDTAGDNSERDVPWPGSEHVTWQDESIGGLEVEYVRADLAAPPDAGSGGDVRAQFEAWAKRQDYLGSHLWLGKYVNETRYKSATARMLWDCWQAATAARQPVGVEPTGYLCKEGDTIGFRVGPAYSFVDLPEGDHALYTAPPAPAAVQSLDELMQQAASNYPLVALVNALDKFAPGFKGSMPKPVEVPTPAAVPVDADLAKRLSRFLQLLSGHDSWPNIRRAYGEKWWEPIDAMRAELDSLATHPQPAVACVDINAMRYLYLRAQPVEGGPWGTPRIAIPSSERAGEFANGDDADAAIDAAIAAQHAHGGDA